MTWSSLKRLKGICAAISLTAVCVLFALPAEAQRAGAGNDDQAAAPSSRQQDGRVIPTIRTAVYDRLNEAQICMEEGDLECANQTLDRVQAMRDLNNYEVAQTYNFRAFLAFETDDYDTALDAYEAMLALPHEDMPDGLIQSSMRNLATLYLQLERYDEGLEAYQEWMALPSVEPSSGDYYLLATIYYQIERYADGIPAIEQAIELANARGEIGEEGWFQLLYVFYFQLEQTDRVIETLTFMVENWTKKTWALALAGQLSGQGREAETLALYEAAYDSGWLDRGGELVQFANLLLQGGAPYKAAILLEEGLNDGTIESTEQNWRLSAQAWQMAQEHEKALPAFERASTLADDGEVDRMLTTSLIRLARWDECTVAARRALTRELGRPDLVNMYLGQCLMSVGEYAQARTAYETAARDERSERDAGRFMQYLQTLVQRAQTNREALASLDN